jgi:hypothetical protein
MAEFDVRISLPSGDTADQNSLAHQQEPADHNPMHRHMQKARATDERTDYDHEADGVSCEWHKSSIRQFLQESPAMKSVASLFCLVCSLLHSGSWRGMQVPSTKVPTGSSANSSARYGAGDDAENPKGCPTLCGSRTNGRENEIAISVR